MAEATAQIRVPVERVAPDAIRLERVLDAPAEKVWRYLTKAELRSQWFMGGTDATGVGEFDLLVNHDNLSDDEVPYPESYAAHKGATWTEKVTRFEPPRLLETTFQGGKNGVVTYELFPEGEKTRLVLTHSGLRQRLEFASHRAGGTARRARRQGFLGAACQVERGGGEGSGQLTMCPICISAGTLIAAGSVSSGGLAALLVGSIRRNHKKDDHDPPSIRHD
jgi:uncharacterized protein YndB with AHSA1/START domain